MHPALIQAIGPRLTATAYFCIGTCLSALVAHCSHTRNQVTHPFKSSLCSRLIKVSAYAVALDFAAIDTVSFTLRSYVSLAVHDPSASRCCTGIPCLDLMPTLCSRCASCTRVALITLQGTALCAMHLLRLPTVSKPHSCA